MIHIKPNYQNPNLECYYCSDVYHNAPSKEFEEMKRLYLTKPDGKCDEVEVHIPCCKDCYDIHHPKEKRLPLKTIWAVSSIFCFLAYYMWVGKYDEPGASVYIIVIILCILAGAVIAGAVSMILNPSNPKEKVIRSLAYYDAYPPIKKLKKIGAQGFKPEKGSAYVNRKLKQEDIDAVFNLIQTEDNCLISES